MICPSCSSDNEAGAKFCNECGMPLAPGCPNCGATNKPGAKFCNECGTQLAGAVGERIVPAAQAAPPVAERRLVTVIFADLVGSTPFAEERDAEEVRDTLSRYFDLCSEIVGRYGGTIEKFIGDAVMAVWGAPVAHEDDAERAVRAALDLVESVTGLAPNAQARAGVLTGQAAVTLGATNQGIVAGDIVNTASRLQSAAQPGTVLVGEATFRAASQAIHFEPVGEQALKGKVSPVPAWRAIRVVAELGGRNRRTEALEAPFIGRTDELRLLKDLFHATGREKKIRLVSVMGPGGIGKSRLAWEFSKYLDGLVETTYWHSGRSPAYGQGVTFWALGEMVRGRAQLLEADDEVTTRQKISDAVSGLIEDERERRWVADALLALLGVATESPSEQLFAAWRTFFERIAEQGTVTMVFEDVHHADTGLLDFIDHMLEWSRGLPIYIITLARPELLDRRSDWGAGKRNFTSIYLEPLADDEMAELLGGLIPGIPERAVKAIVARADGIPLYAVETARMLVADGRLEERDGAYVPTDDLTDLAVPETLTGLISSRLDALDRADRSIIHDAAVLGQSFTIAALAAVSGVTESELERRRAALARRDLIARETDPFSSERGQFAFVQALIREVAYGTLSKKDRKTRHLAAARFFEQLGSDELASALASHYLAAHANAAPGAESEALAAQARVALRAAAERARQLAAHDQAASLLEQAVGVTTDVADQAELLEKAGQSAGAAAQHDRARELFEKAIELYRNAGDRVGSARTTSALGWDLLNDRRNQRGLEVLEAALTEYGDLWPDPAIVLLKVHLARAYVIAEQFQRALQLSEEALEAAERADLVPIIARALVGKGGALGTMGRLREGIALVKAAEDLARAHGLDETLHGSMIVGGFLLGEVDNAAALATYRDGLELARRTGSRVQMVVFINNIGYTGFLVGEWDAALEELEGALADEVGTADRIWLLSNALIVRASRGEDIADGLGELERLAAEHGDKDMAVPILDTKANEALAAGRLEEARTHWLAQNTLSTAYAAQTLYQAARSGIWQRRVNDVKTDLAALDATGVHGRVVEVRRTTLHAAIAGLEGRAGEAIALYSEALRGWSELGMVWDEALTGIDMVSVLDPTDEKVLSVAQSTRAILERLRAQPFLDRLDAALERSTPRAASVPETAAKAVAVESS